jgi:phosphoesterase RecJ-like protein
VIGRYDGERHDADVANVQVIVVLDTNHPGRLRSLQRLVNESSAAKVCIDHHLDPDPFADNYLIDADATSTGEILYRLFMRSGSQRLPPGIAEPLYCAIMTDTGSFRYPRVDPDIHRIAAELIGWGADPVAVYSGVYERWSTGRIHLLGETLAGLRTEASGKLAHVTISREMLSRTSTVEDDTDNFTVYPMSVDGVVLGILFLELDGAVKISFRSKGEIPVNLLAGEFGGGGHKNAAGAHVQEGTLDSVKMRVIAAAAKYVPAAR